MAEERVEISCPPHNSNLFSHLSTEERKEASIKIIKAFIKALQDRCEERPTSIPIQIQLPEVSPSPCKEEADYAFNLSAPGRLEVGELLKGLSPEKPICVAEVSPLTSQDRVRKLWIVCIHPRLYVKLLGCDASKGYSKVLSLTGWMAPGIPAYVAGGAVFVTGEYSKMREVVGVFSKVRRDANPKNRKCQVRVTYP